MDTTVSYPSGHPFRRCSTESILSLQGQETDFVRDTSDTDDSRDVEYEPVSGGESDAAEESEDSSTSEIITTKVIAVSVGDDSDLEFADSEQTDSERSDSEVDLYDYWQCARCRANNNNPIYRYCESCFKVRKNLFPPRPKRKRKRVQTEHVTRALSQDSGVESQELSQQDVPGPSGCSQEPIHSELGAQSSVNNSRVVKRRVESQELSQQDVPGPSGCSQEPTHSELGAKSSLNSRAVKHRADSVDRNAKRLKSDRTDSDSDSQEGNNGVQPLVKTVSDPSVTIDEPVKLTKKVTSESLKDIENDNLCIICCVAPKSGVFVHGRVAHICCCFKCAVKVWTKKKRCPVCNSKVSNVLKAVVM